MRHGQSVWNAARRWQGQADPPLTSLGRAQARAATERLGPPDAIVASDLLRAAETAVILSGHLGVGPVLADPRWRERDVGEWTGLTRGEIDARWPGWLEDHRRPDGFEHDEQVAARALPALLDAAGAGLAGPPAGEPGAVTPWTPPAPGSAHTAARASAAISSTGSPSVVVVTHGGVIRSIERHLGLEGGWVDNLDGLVLAITGEAVRDGARVRLIDHEAVAAEHDEQEAG